MSDNQTMRPQWVVIALEAEIIEANKRIEDLNGVIVRMADDMFLLKQAIRKHKSEVELCLDKYEYYDEELWTTIQ